MFYFFPTKIYNQYYNFQTANILFNISSIIARKIKLVLKQKNRIFKIIQTKQDFINSASKHSIRNNTVPNAIANEHIHNMVGHWIACVTKRM